MPYRATPQEIEAFYRSIAYGDAVESDSALAADTIAGFLYEQSWLR